VPGFSSTLPVLVQRSTQRIAVEAPILSRRAASRALSPSITIEITRALRSFEYPLAIVPPRRCRRSNPNLICTPEGIPCCLCDSRQAENALDRHDRPAPMLLPDAGRPWIPLLRMQVSGRSAYALWCICRIRAKAPKPEPSLASLLIAARMGQVQGGIHH